MATDVTLIHFGATMNRYIQSLAAFIFMAFLLMVPETGWAQAPSALPLKPSADETTRSAAVSTLARVPLHFVANQGQWADGVAYAARSEGATVYCTDQGIAFGFADGQVGLKFSEQRRVSPEARGLLPGVVNYFVGKEAAQWKAGVPTYQEVVYPEVYPGIDLVYEGSHRLLKYTYYLQPGADPGQIRTTFDGVEGVSVDPTTGELVIRTPWGEMRDAAPVAYQEIQGIRQDIAVSFRLIGEQDIGFTVGTCL